MTGQQLFDLLYHVKSYMGHICGYAELKYPAKFRYFRGHGKDPEWDEEIVPAGTTVKVVMASHLGDLGVTKNMDVEDGYQARLEPNRLENCRLTEFNDLCYREQGWDWEIKVWDTSRVPTTQKRKKRRVKKKCL